MNSKAKSLSILSSIFLVIMMVFTSSCFDLGGSKPEGVDEHDFDNYYKDYINCFSDINLLDQSLNRTVYSYKKSFFNSDSVNELRHWTEYDDCIPFNAYSYICFAAKKDIDVCSLSMYLKSDSTDSINIEVYLFKVTAFEYSGNYATYDIWQKKLEDEKDVDESSKTKLSDYDDYNTDDAIAKRKMVLSSSWDSFTFTFYEKGNKDATTPYKIKNGDKIVLMFKNNLGIGLNDDMTKVSFCATNLMVSMPDEE